MVTVGALSPLTATVPAGSPSASDMQRRRSGTMRKGSGGRVKSGQLGSPVGSRGRRVSFYEGPRAPGPATSVISSPSLTRSGSFSGSILKKTPTTATPAGGTDGPMVFPTSLVEPSPPSVKRGHLLKYSLGRSKFLGRRNWRERWFEATPLGLAYYKQNTDKNFVLEVKFGPKDPRQCGHCRATGRPRYTVYNCAKCNAANNSERSPTFLRPNLSKAEFPFIDQRAGNVYFGLSFGQGDREFTLVMQAPDPHAKAEWVKYLHQFNSIHESAVDLAAAGEAVPKVDTFDEMNLESSCGSSTSSSFDLTVTTTDPEVTPTTPLVAASTNFTKVSRTPVRRSSIIRRQQEVPTSA
eukprot:TRINITY_DN2325_c1_g1_i2.p1 TRINITY_DN2325_c1_g1~~TRINITY_DN2325_c1_g1_i2.p1  ORF type:complete len:352 (+),score=46.11 TRINITY_DN2325_c1_g1_i2:107-1162(+)